MIADILQGGYAQEQAKQFKTVPTKVLRDLWLARWGKRHALMQEVVDAARNEEQVVGAMRELCERGQVKFEKHTQYSTMEDQMFYFLEREDGDR